MSEPSDPAALTLDPETMRRLGYRVIDLLVEHHETLAEKPVVRAPSRAELEARLREAPPEQSRDPFAVLQRAHDAVLGDIMIDNHPRFFAFVPGVSNYVGVMADALAAGFNVITAAWIEAAGPAMVELVTVDWLRQLCGFPEGAGGLFVSGGTVANLTALAAARQVKLDGRMDGALVYCSDQTHKSNLKNLRLLGFQPEQLRPVATDAGLRLDPAALAQAVDADRAAGKRPFCVIANAGTTNTGAVDPLPALADLCAAQDLWLHVDGAYGAPAVLTERGKAALRGLERAHSLAIDPHKWLFQPFEIGGVLVRDANWLPQTFAIEQEYMQDTATSGGEVNFCDHGIQLTRGFRALKLWMSIQVFGLAAFRDAIDRCLDLADHAESLLRDHPRFEIVTPAQLGVIPFRYAPADPNGIDSDRLQQAIVEAAIAEGYVMLGTTRLRAGNVLRLCIINPRTTRDDLSGTIDHLAKLGTAQAAACAG